MGGPDFHLHGRLFRIGEQSERSPAVRASPVLMLLALGAVGGGQRELTVLCKIDDVDRGWLCGELLLRFIELPKGIWA